MQAGYVIGDRCLRPALVAVAKGGPKATVPPTPASEGARKPANDDVPGGRRPPGNGGSGARS
jgi:molecular chaperone GrpE